jgi:hypothetical protein
MKPDTKYYVAQLVGVFTVLLPSVLSALLLGGLLARWTGDSGPVGVGIICLSVGYATYRVTSWGTGWLLERLGLLPRDAWRFYPTATSWGGYLKKTGALWGRD